MVRKFSSLLLAPLAMILFLAGVVCAGQHDRLAPLLVGIEGWDAQVIEGTSLALSRMKMISARRAYSKGDKEIAIGLLVNSGPVQDNDLKESSFEDDVARVRVRQVNGYWIKNIYSKKNNSGQLIVHLDFNQSCNAMIMANYSKMSDDEALAVVERFNWDAMKVVVGPML